MKNRSTLLCVSILSVMFLAGCQGSGGQRPSDTGNGDNGAQTSGVSTDGTEGNEDDPNSLGVEAPAQRIIYFDFDRAEIRSEYLEVIAQHGRFLASNSAGRVRLEGHTDERGTREYNIALGERRAQSIARMLQLQGVSSAQTRAVSYGEEVPVDEGHNNEAWAKNRRVKIIYETSIQN